MKVIRVLVYEGSEGALAQQLARSLPDGVKEIPMQNWVSGMKLTVVTVRPEDTAKLGDQVDMLRGVVIKAMDWEAREVD